jgi:hypothetical protein
MRCSVQANSSCVLLFDNANRQNITATQPSGAVADRSANTSAGSGSTAQKKPLFVVDTGMLRCVAFAFGFCLDWIELDFLIASLLASLLTLRLVHVWWMVW